MELNQRLNLEQKIGISQEQRQSLEILACNNVELEQLLQKEYEENPCLEFEIKSGESDIADAGSMVSRSENHSLEHYIQAGHDDVKENILMQLDLSQYSSRETQIIESLIMFLDERGYLEESPRIIAGQLKASPEQVENCLRDLRELEPTGIFSGSIQECLTKQLERMGITRSDIYEIIEYHLDDIAEKKYHKIARAVNVDIDEVKRCERIIKKLNPFPLGGQGAEDTLFIIPDIILEVTKDGWEVKLNDVRTNFYHLSSYYYQMAKDKNNRELNQYLTNKLRRAQAILYGIEQRKETLIKITKALAVYQKDFFWGRGVLKPMRLADISSRVNMHDSTISRAISGKYLQFPYGTILMKELFSGRGGIENCTADNIKDVIINIVEKENKQKPLSDQKIVELLKVQDIDISRRAIAKYRDELGIKSSVERKDA